MNQTYILVEMPRTDGLCYGEQCDENRCRCTVIQKMTQEEFNKTGLSPERIVNARVASLA